jgi:hypothetical protein
MSLAEVEKQALALSERERARLILALLETLPPEAQVSDDEVLQRDADLADGSTQEISHAEFVRGINRERR